MNPTQQQSTVVPLAGALLMVMITFLWGANMPTIKVSSQGVPPILAAAFRSFVASLLLWLYARIRHEGVFFPRKDTKHAVIIGTLFGLDFLFLYWGPTFTHASRAIIFLYTYPILVTIGAHFALKTDPLDMTKTVGVAVAFAGLVIVFGARGKGLGPLYWVGDFMEITAAAFWAANTLYIKKFLETRSVSPVQTLFSQLFYSIPVLLAGWLIFEAGRPVTLSLPVGMALAYQCVVVAFFSYLLWFWLIHSFPVSRLAPFTFLVPIFGVLISSLLLGEETSLRLWLGALLVAAGIYIVNRHQRSPRPAPR